MTYSITICPGERRAKNELSLAYLQKQFGAFVNIGGLGNFFEYIPRPVPTDNKPQAAFLLYGAKNPVGRGFYLYAEKDYSSLEIITDLPTTAHDLEDMFTFVGVLASHLGAKEVRDAFGSYSRAMLPTLFAETAKSNLAVLKNQALNQPGFTVSGVRFPLSIPESVCARIGKVPPLNGEQFFAAYLSDKQHISTEYLKPNFYKDGNGVPTARYDIWVGHSYIAPKSAFVPYGPAPFPGESIASWQVSLLSEQLGKLGMLPYETFIERVAPEETQTFSAEYLILNVLSVRRLQEILEGEG